MGGIFIPFQRNGRSGWSQNIHSNKDKSTPLLDFSTGLCPIPKKMKRHLGNSLWAVTHSKEKMGFNLDSIRIQYVFNTILMNDDRLL